MTRLVVVSNRVANFDAKDANTGGLATALKSALEESGGIWFGWSGSVCTTSTPSLHVKHYGRVARATLDLPKADYDGFYTGFANGTLWPLLHFRVDLMKYDREAHAAYQRVNDRFAQELHKLLKPDDIIWIHDYQLFALGRKLRRLGVNQQIGFFLHTPFPTWQILSALPVHRDLASDLAAYDLVGTQTADDAEAMQTFLKRMLGIRFIGSEAPLGTRRLRVQAFPISIDPERVNQEAARAASSQTTRNLRKSLNGRNLILGVDRLDYTKGIPHRLEAVGQFMRHFPERVDDVTYLQISPPTREEVSAYQQLRTEVEETVGRINGQFSGFDAGPIRYLRKSFSQTALFGFYRTARVGLVTPLRDGMNLVAKEYVASQDAGDPGVLVLSEFAGASKELDGALIVNPHDIDAVALAIHRALNMPREERIARHHASMERLRDNDLANWRGSFLKALASQGSGFDIVVDTARAASAVRPPLRPNGSAQIRPSAFSR